MEKNNQSNEREIETKKETEETPKKRSKIFIIILAILVIGGATFGISKYTHSLHHEETDDAQIEADILPVIPRVSGYIREVKVKDNEFVETGDTLFTIDPRDLQIKVDQTKAALATANANVKASRSNYRAAHSGIASSRAGIGTIEAQIQAANIKLTRAQQDFERYENLIQDHSITQQQYEETKANRDLAQQQLAILQQQKKQVGSQTNVVTSQSSATQQSIEVAETMVKQREVDLENAELNLSYATITAPEAGKVSTVNIQPGQLVQAGQSVFNLVHTKDIWIVANFKETQVRKITPGQLVIVHADAFPGHGFKAKVASFSPATGAKFSLLPPDNATGNFVKVVQRIPVKITFNNEADSLLSKLRPGMNVNVDVHL